MGRKASDRWAVPLCLLHHRSLHDAGDEEDWWEGLGIDPIGEADRLWQEARLPDLELQETANEPVVPD